MFFVVGVTISWVSLGIAMYSRILLLVQKTCCGTSAVGSLGLYKLMETVPYFQVLLEGWVSYKTAGYFFVVARLDHELYIFDHRFVSAKTLCALLESL